MNGTGDGPVEVWLCVDFEATCDEGDIPMVSRDQAELIEFAFAIYDAGRDTVSHLGQHYCKNVRTPLTTFCTQLTGITAEKLKDAGSLNDALSSLEAVLQSEPLVGRSICAVAHGSWDLEVLLPSNCAKLGMSVPPVLQRYVDLRATTQKHFPGERVSSLAEICRALAVPMEGREHCGVDDAKMVALAMQALLKRGASTTICDPGGDEAAFHSAADTRLCLEGLPWSVVAGEVTHWLRDLGHTIEEDSLQMVLSEGGRPSGRAVVHFSDHEDAARALRGFRGGKVIVSGAISRLVLLRPVRDTERLIPTNGETKVSHSLISFPADALTLARLRSSGGPQVEKRPGDWVCPACHDLVFARNSACRHCGCARPDGDVVPSGVVAAMYAKPGDWICPACQDLVFARNTACRKCGTSKPGSSTGKGGYSVYRPGKPFEKCDHPAHSSGKSKGKGGAADLRPGDWLCPTCGDHVFAKNAECRRCHTQKPVR